MLNGIQAALYREIHIYRKKAKKQVLASSISPLLFLIAFGWGFGEKVAVNGLPYIVFLIPGLITMATLNQSYGIAQELNISRFYFHVFDEYLIAPVTYTEIVLGEALYGMFRSLISIVLIFFYVLLFGVDLQFHPLFIPAVALHCFLFSVLAITVSMMIRDHGSQAQINTFVVTPMIFLCGTFFPVDKLPEIFRLIVHILPLTYPTKMIRASLTGGTVSLYHMAILFAGSVFFFCTAVWAIRRVEA